MITCLQIITMIKWWIKIKMFLWSLNHKLYIVKCLIFINDSIIMIYVKNNATNIWSKDNIYEIMSTNVLYETL